MGREQMKRIGIAVLITAMVLSFSGCKFGDNIKINEKNFPDENLRTAVQDYDTDNNGCHLLTEAVGVAEKDESTKLDCYIYEGNDGHGLYVDKDVELICEKTSEITATETEKEN